MGVEKDAHLELLTQFFSKHQQLQRFKMMAMK